LKTYILGVDTIDAGKPKTIEGKNTNNKIIIPIVAIAIVAVSIVAYQYLQPSTQVNINGSGATFPQPLLNAMIPAYKNLKTNVVINYQGIGSGGGISALQGKTVDFAGSDAPLSATERNLAPNSLHIPETIGAVTIAYNIPNIPSGMHLTGQVIADIFAGNITTWNNAAIQNLNPNMTLPSNSIFTVHRSDGSGTTFVFTGYLSKVSAGWNHTIGQAKSVSWPVGV
jgi:phosphate ABC transporter phosphate-binding protein